MEIEMVAEVEVEADFVDEVLEGAAKTTAGVEIVTTKGVVAMAAEEVASTDVGRC